MSYALMGFIIYLASAGKAAACVDAVRRIAFL